jgi:carboxylesterase type B
LLFQNYTITTEEEVTADLQQLWPSATQDFFTQLYSLYPLSGFNETFFSQPFFSSSLYSVFSELVPSLTTSVGDTPLWQVATIFGDAVVDCPSRNIASSVSAAAQPIWKLECAAGVYVHAASSVFVLAEAAESGNATLSNIMRSWYLNFVTDLDPNTAGGLQWPEYGTGNGAVMIVTDDGVRVQSDPDASMRCEFFAENANVVRN